MITTIIFRLLLTLLSLWLFALLNNSVCVIKPCLLFNFCQCMFSVHIRSSLPANLRLLFSDYIFWRKEVHLLVVEVWILSDSIISHNWIGADLLHILKLPRISGYRFKRRYFYYFFNLRLIEHIVNYKLWFIVLFSEIFWAFIVLLSNNFERGFIILFSYVLGAGRFLPVYLFNKSSLSLPYGRPLCIIKEILAWIGLVQLLRVLLRRIFRLSAHINWRRLIIFSS